MENLVSHCVKFDKHNLQLILRYYRPFKSDPPSQQQKAALLILLPQYSDNDIIHILLKIK